MGGVPIFQRRAREVIYDSLRVTWPVSPRARNHSHVRDIRVPGLSFMVQYLKPLTVGKHTLLCMSHRVLWEFGIQLRRCQVYIQHSRVISQGIRGEYISVPKTAADCSLQLLGGRFSRQQALCLAPSVCARLEAPGAELFPAPGPAGSSRLLLSSCCPRSLQGRGWTGGIYSRICSSSSVLTCFLKGA